MTDDSTTPAATETEKSSTRLATDALALPSAKLSLIGKTLDTTESLKPMAQEPDVEPPVRLSLDPQGEVHVRGEATIHNAALLLKELRTLASSPSPPIALSLAELDALDTAGAQLLIAFKRRCPGLRVHSSTERVRQFIEITGLTDLLV